MFYVYELIDPRDGEVFYVGKGKGARIDQHEREARAGRVSRKCDRIRELEAAGHAVQKRKISTHRDEVDAYDAEAGLIARYGLAALTNVMSRGGRGGNAGPTAYEDRINVLRAGKTLRRTQQLMLSGHAGFTMLGETICLTDIAAALREVLARIEGRRGHGWVQQVVPY